MAWQVTSTLREHLSVSEKDARAAAQVKSEKTDGQPKGTDSNVTRRKRRINMV
ncbi:hypothetical protein AB6F62_16690 [Providencia huaxiensis]|uniref:hypothetical protein n=1 Tax=Providencia huaxiensis TaxID=2027290 RepID=UPI0034DD852F